MAEIIENAALLERITTFLARHGLSRSGFGDLAIGDGGLVTDMERGRKLRGITQLKIIEFMEAYEKAQEERDEAALALISRCGFVSLLDGEPVLQTHTQIAKLSFDRLLAAGRLIPNNDAMFDVASQTFKPAEVAHG